MIFGAIVLAFFAGTIAFCTQKKLSSSEDSVSVPVAVVIEDQTKLMNVLLSFLADMPSTADHFRFRVMTETDARTALENGSVAAVMLVPKDVISGIMDGTNLHVQVLLSEKNALAAILLQELSAAGAKTLSSAQAGTYTITTLYRNAGRADALPDAYTALDIRNLSYALSRGDLFRVVHGSTAYGNAAGEESVGIYYLCSGILLFLLLFGICYLSFYQNQTGACEEKARSCGIGYPCVLAARLLGILLYQLFLLAAAAAAFLGCAPAYGLSASDCLHMLFLTAGILLGLGCFFFFLYELVPSPGCAMLALFLTAFLMMLVSGCLIPNAFLPAWCGRLAKLLPVKHWMQQLFHLFSYPAHTSFRYPSLADTGLLITTGYSLLFLAGGCLAHIGRRKRLLS